MTDVIPRGESHTPGARSAAADAQGPPRYAVIDAGTNSIKLLVADRTRDGGWHTVVDRTQMTRLGEALQETGVIGPAAVERAVTAVAAMAKEARELGAVALAAVGTAALRLARNQAVVVEAIAARTGVRIEVIPGAEEARIAYGAATTGLGPIAGPLAVFDTGGGSTQLTFGHAGAVDERFSVDVGAVRYTERFGLAGPVATDDLHAALAAMAADLVALDERPPVTTLVGMGGGVTTIAAVSHGLAAYDREVVQGTVIDREEIERQVELYRTRGTDERQAIAGVQPGRADVILAGACIVRTIMDGLGARSFTVSDRGLRHGVLDERFGARGAMPGQPAVRAGT